MTYFDLDHDSTMIRFAVGTLHLKLNGDGRYFDRIKLAIEAGEAIRPGSDIDRHFEADIRTLNALSGAMMAMRDALISNGMPRLRLIAAE